jgi:hypothetical protein
MLPAPGASTLLTSTNVPTPPRPPLQEPCSLASFNALSCLHGFAIQGNFEPQRRNYTRVWSMLQARLAAGDLPTAPPLPPLHLHLIGRGAVEALKLPAAVKGLTTVHFNERYPQYYERVRAAWGRGRRVLCSGPCPGVKRCLSGATPGSLLPGPHA